MQTQKNDFKICVAASAGGHLTQALKLARSWQSFDTFFVTTSKSLESQLQNSGRVYIVEHCDRNMPLEVLKALWRCLKITVRERPDIVISTGAAVGCIICYIAKFMGKKVIWIDSITNVEKLSLSGRLVRHIADILIVQWPELATSYKCAEYFGPII
jgi:UDP-N-acetylglucosamine:LPS N-acetylglucosamine transferase